MDVKIIAKDKLKLLGCVFYGNPFHSVKGWSMENEIGLLWKRFHKVLTESKESTEHFILNPTVSYEVHIDPVTAKEEKKWYVFVGIEVKSFEVVPLEFFCKVLPKTKYAVFTAKGDEIRKANDYIYKNWLPASKYEEAYSYQMQVYDSKTYKGIDAEDSEIKFYIPIKEK